MIHDYKSSLITFIPTSSITPSSTCYYSESYDAVDSHYYTYCRTSPSVAASYFHTAADNDDYDANEQLRIHGSRVHAAFPSSAWA